MTSLSDVLDVATALKEQGNQQMKEGGSPKEAVDAYTEGLTILRSTREVATAKTSLKKVLLLNRCRALRRLHDHRAALKDAFAVIKEGDSTGNGHCLAGRSLEGLVAEAKRGGYDSVIVEEGKPPVRLVEAELQVLQAFYSAVQASKQTEFLNDYRNARKTYFTESMSSHRSGITSHMDTIQLALVEMGLVLDRVSAVIGSSPTQQQKQQGQQQQKKPGSPTGLANSRSIRESLRCSDSDSEEGGGGGKGIDLDDLNFENLELPDGGGVLLDESLSETKRRLESMVHRGNAMTSLAILRTYLEDDEVIRHLSLSSRGNSVARFDVKRCPDAPKPFGTEVPQCFQCPLSLTVMQDPVMIQSSTDPKIVSKESFERKFIVGAFMQVAAGMEYTDPSTRISYGTVRPHFIPNNALKEAIAAYLQCYPHLYET